MGDRFSPRKDSCYLQYLDVNNLYSWVMSQNLPTSGLRWVEIPEKLKGNIDKLAKEAGKGYLLEVDISYPNDLHYLHNSLLSCARREDQWSPKAGSKSV